MRFVVDAQLPEALVDRRKQLGHDAIHVKHLPGGSDTSDSEITRLADAEDRVVVTKDSDFRHTHETGGHPTRLLLISAGNVRNRTCTSSSPHTMTRSWMPSRRPTSSNSAQGP